jgi:glyoxylase-like metal-dependent hydrolase (beta-lactamase superfamily II)
MRVLSLTFLLGCLAVSVPSAQNSAAILDAAEKAMGTVGVSSLHYEGGDGALYLVGAPLVAGGPWRDFALQHLAVDVHYDPPSMRQAWVLGPSKQPTNDGVTEFGGATQEWLVYGKDAWDIRGRTPRAELPLWEPYAQSNMAEWRNLEIWMTPPGFIKAAKAHHASVRREGSGFVVSFVTGDRQRFTGHLSAQNLVERIESSLANTVMGDMSFVTTFADYQTFGSIRFPKRITETVGGYPFLELSVSGVNPDGAAPVGPMPPMPSALCVGCARGNVTFKSQKLGDGVWYLDAGDNFASVVVEFKDYLVVFEGPHNDERSSLVIAEARRLVPDKPIRYLALSHWHFDHLGGARRFAAQNATILVSAQTVTAIEKYLNAPHTLRPDAFSKSGRKSVSVEGVQGKKTLSDGTQTLELYVLHLEHAEPTLFAYLPREQVLVTTDVAVAPRPGAAPPRMPVPDSLQLYTQLVEKKIAVEHFAGIHWGISTWKDLLLMVGK